MKKGAKKYWSVNIILLLIISAVLLFVNINQTLSAEDVNNTTTESVKHLWIRDRAISSIAFDSTNNLVYFVSLVVSPHETNIFAVYNRTSNVTENLTGTGNWDKTDYLNDVAVANDNLVYFVGVQSGVSANIFAVYNRTSNVTENLNTTDGIGDWMGTGESIAKSINAVVFNSINNMTYIGGRHNSNRPQALFGAYNRTSNQTHNLSGSDLGNWVGDTAITSLTFDNISNRIYFVGDSGLFGYYDPTTNVSHNLSTRDIDGFMDSGLTDVAFDPFYNVTYLVGLGGRFGVYNGSTNITYPLNTTYVGFNHSNNYAFSDIGIANNGLIYITGQSEIFWIYNRTANQTHRLNSTDVGNWIEGLGINSVAYDSTNNLAYLGGYDGVFGTYNITSNLTEDLNVPNDWLRYGDINCLTLDSTNDLIYFAGENFIFGAHNKTLNNKEDLRTSAQNLSSSTSFLNAKEMAFDSANNIVYFGGQSGFGMYDRTTNTTEPLNQSAGSLNITTVEAMTYDSVHDILYVGIQTGGFAYYDRSENKSYTLKATGSLFSTINEPTDLYYDEENDVVWVVGDDDLTEHMYGFYDRSGNLWGTANKSYKLTGTDTDLDSWMGTGQLNTITYDYRNNVAYVGGVSGVFGLYNNTTNLTYNLGTTDLGDWMGSSDIYSLAYDGDNDVTYISGQSGVFGFYNLTNNTTYSLMETDEDDWIGTQTINDLFFDTNDNVVYLVGTGGVFGFYNLTANSTVEASPLGAGPDASENTGGSGSASSTSVNSERVTIGSVSGGGSASAIITDPKIDIRNVTIFPKENIENASLTISTDTTTFTNILIASTLGTVYQSFDIEPVAIENENLNNVTFDFRVNKTWLSENNYTYNDVVLYRLPSENGTWQELPTASITEDETYYHFTSTSPGFSTFTIFVRKLPCDIGALRCFNNEVQLCTGNSTWITTETCENSCMLGKCTNGKSLADFAKKINVSILMYMGIILVISGAIVMIILTISNIRKNTIKKGTSQSFYNKFYNRFSKNSK